MVMLLISLLLASEFLGLFPDNTKSRLSERKFLVETLTVNVATQLDEINDQGSTVISELLRTTVQRNNIVKSVAIRGSDGSLIESYGNHDKNWTLEPDARSTPTQVQFPLFKGERKIASVEVHFNKLNEGLSLIDRRASFPSVLIFVALSGFFTFSLFLKRILREMDPDAVIPERVKKALDTLAEGLLIINTDGEIVFSNAEFATTAGIASEDLAGQNCNTLKWQLEDNQTLPWNELLRGGEMPTGATVKLNTGFEQLSTFTVNATPIIASANEIRGALVTFNDITEVEIKNAELRNANSKLKDSQLEIKKQNKELEYLATRDPLTGSLNRRSFFTGFDSLFDEASKNGDELTCIMTDIDHFKSVNDTHGHGVGDDVIKYLADVLADHARPNDLVGRFGGEEFCVVLPETPINEAYTIAEKIRLTIEQGVNADFFDKCQITASFGVASLQFNPDTPSVMVEHADKALYVSKESGRNQVTNYSPEMDEENANQPDADVDARPATTQAVVKPAVPIFAQPAPVAKSDEAIQTDEVEAETPARQNKQIAPVMLKTEPDTASIPLFSDNKSSPVLQQSSPTGSVAATDETATTSGDVSSGSAPLRLNRNLLLDRLSQSIQSASKNNNQVGFFMITIEALHRVNDVLGFSISKKLYAEIANRLKSTLKADTELLANTGDQAISVSRYGDTEICLTIHNVDGQKHIERIYQQILDAFDQTFSVDGHEIYTALDIGVSIFPEHGDNADQLIRRASIAMREAEEEAGQNNICHFHESMDTVSRRLITLETALHQALKRNELFVVYQPKVDLETGEIVSMEALIRWRHPEMGIITPGEFIPVAETTGLINDISAWVTRVVCAQLSIWHEAGHTDLTVSVNVSPAEMKNEFLAHNILGSIKEFGIQASALEVEITESMAMRDMDKAVRTLDKLANAGVEISIDDFGTGYASLSYLKQLPIGKLKIDRLFIADLAKNPSDARIVSGVIAMSHSLGMTVVCEGIEEVEQLRFLQDNHCDQVQGNLLSLPLQYQEATKLLADPRRIRRLVTEYKVSELGFSSNAAAGPAMLTGVLNEFPDAASTSDDLPGDTGYEGTIAANG